MAQSQFDLLKEKRFMPLFLTQFFAAFNDNVFKNALIILMTYKAARDSGVDSRVLVTAASGIFILPFFLFSATAGQIADKFQKHVLIRRIRLGEVFVMLFAAGGFFLQNYNMLLAILFCAGAISTFFGPLKYSILPEHLKEEELIGGNALIEAGTFLAILLGTIVGGLLILNDDGAVIISAILVGIAVLCWLTSLKIPAAPSGKPDLKISYNFIGETWRMLRQAPAEKVVFLSIIGISWFWLVGFTFLAQFPIYASHVLGADEHVVTLFLTVFSVGIAIGSLICNRLLKGAVSSKYVPLGAFGMSAGIFMLWLGSPAPAISAVLIGIGGFIATISGWIILASLLAVAVFGGIFIVPLYTIMQTRSEKSRRSRTIAVNNIMNALFMVLGAVITMFLMKMRIAVTDIFLLVGLINIPVALLIRRIVKMQPLL